MLTLAQIDKCSQVLISSKNEQAEPKGKKEK
jgi:hypothetical protein